MPLTLQQWKQDIWAWRLIGAAFYHTIIVLAAAVPVAACSLHPWRASIASFARSLISPFTWISLLSLCATQVLVIVGKCLMTLQEYLIATRICCCEAVLCMQPKPHC